MSEEEKFHEKKRNRWLIALAAIFLFLGILGLLYWVLYARFYVVTDDAYVGGNTVPLTPQVSSGVVAIFADETDLVQKGQLVVQLERLDFEIEYQFRKAQLAETVREVAKLFENVKEREAEIRVRKAELQQRRLDLLNREGLTATGALSKEEFEQMQTHLAVARFSLELAERQWDAAYLLVAGTTVETHPLVKEAVSQLRKAYLDLIRCAIWAPVTGYVVNRTVQVGDQVTTGQTLLTIVPLDFLWLEANYKETSLKNVRIGQPVTFTADLYGRSIRFNGKVLGFSPGTGSAFALLPPENASGNWIKIIQRVPVRVSIDPEEIKKYPLLIGLSLKVRTNVHDTSGDRLALLPTEKPLFTTAIYDEQFLELEKLNTEIDSIISQNLPKVTNNLEQNSECEK